MSDVLIIAGASARRYLRDRRALVFVLVLPVLVILVVGLTVRGSNRFRVGLVVDDHGPLASELVGAISRDTGLQTHTYGAAAARTALRRNELDAVVHIPDGYDSHVRTGRPVAVGVTIEPANSTQQAALGAVQAIVAKEAGVLQAARFAGRQAPSSSYSADLARSRALAAGTGAVTSSTRFVNSTSSVLPLGYSYSAPTMLVLFVFINSLAAGAIMIRTRQLGIYERVRAAPVATRQIVAGETLCYLGLALFQSSLIIVIGAALFGVSWGPVLPAVALVVVWALVGTAAGMLSGTVFRTPEQASSIGPSLGIALGMLGGCMWPLEIVGTTMARVGHLTPQAWAVDAWTALLSRGAGLSGIATDLLILLAFATALFTLATTRMARNLNR